MNKDAENHLVAAYKKLGLSRKHVEILIRRQLWLDEQLRFKPKYSEDRKFNEEAYRTRVKNIKISEAVRLRASGKPKYSEDRKFNEEAYRARVKNIKIKRGDEKLQDEKSFTN
jgi:hypothetical protein